MDCDDVMLLIANRASRTMTGVEETRFHDHVSGCETCQQLAAEPSDDEEYWRWLSRVPADAVEGSELLALPMVDPVVFQSPTELASGGMGRITRAVDRRLGREVAIKEVLEHDLRPRFEREVRITARLQHPAIVPIYEAGMFPDGSTFYTMRLVPGKTLTDAIDEAPSIADRLRLMPHVRAVADALSYAHTRGVIHRDLKPSNVLVGEFGETVVIDWGLAKETSRPDDVLPATSGAPHLTRTGTVIGTPCFMSPAQAAGASVGPADDVYAIGAILYHLLAGTPPYWDSAPHDADALIAATLDRPPTPIATLAPDAPADLHAIVEHAMHRDKTARFPTATELAQDLARFEAGQLLKSRSYSSRELFVRWLRRNRLKVALVVTGIIAALVVAGLWLRVSRAADELAIRERGERLTEVYGDVARQAYVIDRDLLRLETALEGLASATAWALAGPEPTGERPFFTEDFADPMRRPDDFTDTTAYRFEVSVEHPVVATAPGVDRATVLPDIRRLLPLRHHIRAMVVDAAVRQGPPPMTPAAAAELLRSRESPIDYAYVDLPAGVHVVWPGMAKLRADYDVRKSSFYLNSEKERGRRWGAPYVDSTTDQKGDDLVLPCTKSVWSDDGKLLAVTGVELTVTKLLTTSMRMTTRSPLRVSLVNGDGKKVLDSSVANQLFPTTGRDEAVQFSELEYPSIVEAIQKKREGIEEIVVGGRSIVVAFVRLDAIGWYYVVEVDAASLGR